MVEGDICSVCCLQYISQSSSPPLTPTSVPSALQLNTLRCVLHVHSQEKHCHQLSGPVPSSGSAEGVVSPVCACSYGVCTSRSWVGCHPSSSVELIGMAAVRADANLMCQVRGITRAAITSTDKQVTLTEVMLLQDVRRLNKLHRGAGSFILGPSTEVTAV